MVRDGMYNLLDYVWEIIVTVTAPYDQLPIPYLMLKHQPKLAISADFLDAFSPHSALQFEVQGDYG